ncbi:PpiC-type peptidyl-prolyl cis-trans isomerase [Methylocella silvestris BL2]|uniref:Parvulin-like PPIase n=1 Tax=Methylocella silvestris (strain DSM 15510 / CIP 108128 / LMG 27833 / NCIMB 13906 / BL2) TaxID=395965 RepID=B8EJS5_METSB|nr:peptidylprolyl isomerase [Methylocella silvestris]ACK49479.1 PpiC-type peptidyl-prolyl cis-trans isomerase [Methylocella silvestris BL2]
MLDAMRAATKGWIGRTVMGIVLGFIILSFAVWGIGDIFRGFGANKLAEVGNEQITTEAFRFAYQTELQRAQRQARRAITNDEAKRFGLDRQVLSRLVSEAVLDQETHALGLAMSDAEIARTIAADPSFKGASGQFDRARFEELLRDNGLTEKAFVREQRGVYLRQELIDSMTNGLQLPKAMLELIHRYQTETRTLDYFVLPAAAAGTIALPSDDELGKYFEDRKLGYSAPEYRTLVTLTLTPESIAKPDAVSDADALRRYDEIKGEKYGAPEKRQIDQLFFSDPAAAAAAREKLDAGASFEDIVAQQGSTMKDVSLGLVTRGQLIDKAVADVAFALPESAVSAPVKTQFGSVLIRVAAIEPSSAKPFEDVKEEIKREIATTRARGEIARLHDAIEDQRASGKTLTEAAKSAGLEVRVIPAVDAGGKDAAGVPIADLANSAALLKAGFASDLGVDNETLSLPQGGYQWFEVGKIDRARQKSFEEAKPAVEKAWRDDETAKLMTAKTIDLTKRLESGEPMAKVAAEGGFEVKRAQNVRRGGGDNFPQPAVAQAFNVGVGGVGSTRLEAGDRLVFKVAGATAPPIDFADATLVSLANEVKKSYSDDLVTQYLGTLQNKLGVKINAQALAAATSGSADLY